jgi:hypothetical protein
MSDQLFEIAFSGQIADGADLETVKLQIGAIFKADAARLEQLFSGKRMIIKRSVDAVTAAKYRGAFEKAGAICEVVALDQAENQPAQIPVTESKPAIQPESSEPYVSRYPESEQIPPALLTEPLGVQGHEIPDLPADVAPVGSMMQHHLREDPEPDIDTSGFDVAPVGSILKTSVDEEPPPPPDTSGLSMAD